MKFCQIIPQVNTHRLTRWTFHNDFILLRRRPWRPPAARCCVCSSVRRSAAR